MLIVNDGRNVGCDFTELRAEHCFRATSDTQHANPVREIAFRNVATKG